MEFSVFVVGLLCVKLVPNRKWTHDLKNTHATFCQGARTRKPAPWSRWKGWVGDVGVGTGLGHIAHFVFLMVWMGVGAGLDHTRRVFLWLGRGGWRYKGMLAGTTRDRKVHGHTKATKYNLHVNKATSSTWKGCQSNFFSLRCWRPRPTFSLRWKSIFLKKYNVLGRFGDRFWVRFGPILGCCFGQGLSSVGVDVCVFVCGCQTQSADGPPCWPGSTAWLARPPDPPAQCKIKWNSWATFLVIHVY